MASFNKEGLDFLVYDELSSVFRLNLSSQQENNNNVTLPVGIIETGTNTTTETVTKTTTVVEEIKENEGEKEKEKEKEKGPSKSSLKKAAKLAEKEAAKLKKQQQQQLLQKNNNSSTKDEELSKKQLQVLAEKKAQKNAIKIEPDYEPTEDDELISGNKTLPMGPKAHEKYYITTAIAYTNSNPHVGHAYEILGTDMLARYQRMTGRDVFFLTGTDEHGQKVATNAESKGMTPIAMCDMYSKIFQDLYKSLRTSQNFFGRTTMASHHQVCQQIWVKCDQAGDIYLDKYEGWYMEREETYVTEEEAKLTDYKDPVNGKNLEKKSEESYFFKMSKYHTQLQAFIEENPDFIQPEQFRQNILTRLKKDALRDVSFSRTGFSWGIPVPKGFDKKHVMYVWCDALINYLHGVQALDPTNPLSKYWPAEVHVIGKDIIWFHCVIWPSILMSAGLPLPKTVMAHGFISGEDGRKMSKSLGNVVDPIDVMKEYSVDTIRYYLARETQFGNDLSFSKTNMEMMHNAELADSLGNLVHRAVSLCSSMCNGMIPDVNYPLDYEFPFSVRELLETCEQSMNKQEIQTACVASMQAVRDCNKYLHEKEPWKLKKEEEQEEKVRIIRVIIEAIYIVAHFLVPYIPIACTKIFNKLNTKPKTLFTLDEKFQNLLPGTPVKIGSILFSKIETKEELALRLEQEEKKKTATTSKTKKGGGGNPKANDEHKIPFTKLDIRVGEIKKIWDHPEADKLYCEEIDIGNNQIVPICSGLKDYYTKEEMLNRKVLVMCNLKPSKMKGFESQGMVLAAKGEPGKVELVGVPENAVVGEKVVVDGHENVASIEKANKKVLDAVLKELCSDSDCCATFGGLKLKLKESKGICNVASLANTPIS